MQFLHSFCNQADYQHQMAVTQQKEAAAVKAKVEQVKPVPTYELEFALGQPVLLYLETQTIPGSFRP